MVELRRARPGEEREVAALWHRVFGDDEAFLADFCRLGVPYDRMLVISEDGTVRCILCAPEITLRCPNGKSLKSGYMYALATEPELRGRGFGKELMRYGEVYLKGIGADCAILVPAEPSLFRFFDELRYVPAFSHLRQELTAEDISGPAAGDSMTPAAPEEYNAIRRQRLEGRLYTDYDSHLVELQQLLAQAGGGDIFRLDLPGGPGCAAVELADGLPVVKELLCDGADVDRAAALLACRFPAERYVLRLPPWLRRPGDRVTWGAIRWLYDHPSPWCPEGMDGYLGLAFD